MEGGPPTFPPGFTCPVVLRIQLAVFPFRIRDYHSLWWTVPCPSARVQHTFCCPYPGHISTAGLASSAFARHYLDVSVQAVPHAHLWIQCTLTELHSAGFPHSDIHGSMPAFGSPWLFADCCVLRRLLVPRHSPCALCSLTIITLWLSPLRAILLVLWVVSRR